MKKSLGNISISVVSGMLALVVGVLAFDLAYVYLKKKENASNWMNPNTQFDSELGWSSVSNRELKHEWGTIRSNSLGFRSEEMKPNKKDIVILGDSVAWGYGVGDEDIFSAQLQKMFDGVGYQVHNLAVSGYGMGQYYLYLKRHLDLFDDLEHVILIIYAPNDLYDTKRNASYGKRKPLFVLKDGELELKNSPVRKYCLRNLFSMSYLLARLSHYWPHFGGLLSRIAGDKDVGFEMAQEVTEVIIQRMDELVRSKGARLTLVLSPSVYDLFKKTEGYRWFESFCWDSDIPCIDYQKYIRKNSKVPPAKLFWDPHHYNRTGHALLAGALDELILSPAQKKLKNQSFQEAQA